MKFNLPFFLLTVSIFLFFGVFVYAGTELEDYNFQYEQYGPVHDNYIKARDSYFTYGTLTSRDEMINASREFLLSRTKVLGAYVNLLKYKLSETTNVPSESRTYLALTLDQESGWLTSHGKDIQNLSTPSIDDIMVVSARFETKKDSWQKLSYQVLSNIMVGKMHLSKSESETINILLSDRINASLSASDTSTLKQWLETAKDNTYNAGKNIENADFLLNQMSQSSNIEEIAGFYENIQKDLDTARQNLLYNIAYQREILREVK